jgi:hypothetical protein
VKKIMCWQNKLLKMLVALGLLFLGCPLIAAHEFFTKRVPENSNSLLNLDSAIIETPKPPAPESVQWKHLFRDSFRFLAVEHAFRCATEGGTREGFGNPFFSGYISSVGSLHGWADGDEFYVNYVGHPMQGAVASYIWANNDPRYYSVSVSSAPKYWKAKLRGLAFSFLQSAQFEIGPVSEASIGNIQREHPQHGFVDYVMTPAGGMAWVLTEDALDKYVVRGIEARTNNRWLRLLARGGLNPARSMANVMGGKVPWHRNDRPGVLNYDPSIGSSLVERSQTGQFAPPSGVDRFNFVFQSVFRTYLGADSPGQCVGGEGLGAFRLAARWQAVVSVGGCKMMDLPESVSGDSLDYLFGLRWSPGASKKWNPRVQVLVGGTKVTQERMFQEEKQALAFAAKQSGAPGPKHEEYTAFFETNNFAMRGGLSLDVKLTSALGLQLVSLDYAHAWGSSLPGSNYRNSLQLTTGMVLRIGTW